MAAFQSLVPASVFVEWRAQTGLKERDMQGLLECGSMCCGLHHVHLQECYFNETGSRHICRFSAPDAESVRTALRAVDVRADSIWAGRVFNRRKALSGNVAIEQALKSRRGGDTVDILEELAQQWQQQYGFHLVRAIVSLDYKRAVFLCSAPSREAIGRATAEMILEGTAVWPYRLLASECR